MTRSSPDDDVHDQSTVVLFASAMTIAIVASSGSLVRHRPVPRRRALWWSGLGLIWAGAAINRIAKWQLGKNYRTKLTLVADHEVVRHGLYRHVRHPMYSGAVLICLGAAMSVASPASTAWVLPVASLVHRINVEEAMLRDTLHQDYADYIRDRSRLLPGLW